MREILFRGKRPDGIWVEGYYFAKPILEKHFILLGENQWMVDPETVGQYTGLKDKNGKRIFEGDLCLCDRHINDLFDKTVFEIKYDPVRGFYGEAFSEIEAWEFCMCEVIGNIHNDPQPLKED